MVERVPTGIEGFDDLIEGGFPRNSVNLISGPSGSAKSLFCLHFVFNGAKLYGEPSVYLSMEEGKKNLMAAMKSFGMESSALEEKGLLGFIDVGEIRKIGTEEFVDLNSVQAMLDSVIKSHAVKRVVVDSIAVIGIRSRQLDDFRRQIFQFGKFLNDKDVTALLVTESMGADLTRFGVEQFIADSFIYLGLERTSGELSRTILVRKMRLTNHDISVHPFLITNKGMKVSGDVKVL